MSMNEEYRDSDSPFVARVWQSHAERPGSFTSVASVHWEMVLQSDGGQTTFTVRGPETRAMPLEYPAGPDWFGITFALGTFMPNLPPGKVIDHKDVNLPAASCGSVWLDSCTWEVPNYENAESFVDRLVRAGLLVRDPLVEAVREGQRVDLSPRTVQHRFQQATGLSHRKVVQIERAQQALAMLEHGASILDTVHATGYFDQPHLTRALRQYIGQTPARIALAPNP